MTRPLYRVDLGLDTYELLAFLHATQPEKWEQLIGLRGGQDKAQQMFSKRVADEIDSRGTIHVLRRRDEDGRHVRPGLLRAGEPDHPGPVGPLRRRTG